MLASNGESWDCTWAMKENTEARKACTEVRLENSAEMMVNRLGKLESRLEK